MLDALAIIGAQIFLDLPAARLAFLVKWNADFAIGRGHRLGRKAGIFALDVEKANFAEVENPFVPIGPMRHPAAVDIVRQMVDFLEARAHGIADDAGFVDKVDIVNRQRFGIVERRVAIDQINECAADPFDCRDPQFHDARLAFDWLCAALKRFGIGLGGVPDAEMPCRTPTDHVRRRRMRQGCAVRNWRSG